MLGKGSSWRGPGDLQGGTCAILWGAHGWVGERSAGGVGLRYGDGDARGWMVWVDGWMLGVGGLLEELDVCVCVDRGGGYTWAYSIARG